MSLFFALNHGVVAALVALASSSLGELGGYQNGALYLTYTLSTLVLAVPVVVRVGSRGGLLIGLSLYAPRSPPGAA